MNILRHVGDRREVHFVLYCYLVRDGEIRFEFEPTGHLRGLAKTPPWRKSRRLARAAFVPHPTIPSLEGGIPLIVGDGVILGGHFGHRVNLHPGSPSIPSPI